MVKSCNARFVFVIDVNWLIKKSISKFYGSEIFQYKGKNVTFIYSFLQDILRLRVAFGINDCSLIIGNDSINMLSENDVEIFCNFINDFKLPHKIVLSKDVAEICSEMIHSDTFFVSGNQSFLQFTEKDGLHVALQRTEDVQVFTKTEVHRKFGIAPKHIPTFLALTKSKSSFTKIQACRLIELYGAIPKIKIYQNKLPATLQKKINLSIEDMSKVYSANFKQLSCKKFKHSALIKCKENFINNINHYGFYSLIRLIEKNPSEIINHSYPDSQDNKKTNHICVERMEDFNDFQKAFELSEYAVIDTETDDSNPRLANLFGISFAFEKDKAYFFPLIETPKTKHSSKLEIIELLKILLEKYEKKFIGHNIRYDLLVLKNHGFTCQNLYFDTMLAAYDCYGDLDFLNLKYLSRRFLNKEIKAYSDIVSKDKTFLDVPFSTLLRHGCNDAIVTLELFNFLKNELKDKKILNSYFNERIKQTICLTRFEKRGIKVNFDNITTFRSKLFDKLETSKQHIFSAVGTGFEITSNKNTQTVLINHAGMNELKFISKMTVSTLEQFGKFNEIARMIVHHRRLYKSIVQIDSIINNIKNSFIFPVFNQIKSKSGRLISSKPNIFSVIDSEEYRRCFPSELYPYFLNSNRSFEILGTLCNDRKLSKSSMESWGNRSKNIESATFDLCNFFLNFISGFSNRKLSVLYMLDATIVTTVNYELQQQYKSVFDWLANTTQFFKENGYVIKNGRKKYLFGGSSSSLEKRNQAINHAIKWLIDWDEYPSNNFFSERK